MLQQLKRALKNPQVIRNYVSWKLLKAHVALHNSRTTKRSGDISPPSLPEMIQIEDRRKLDTDISDHLPTLFAETVNAHPRLIMELGVRGGDSTFALERAARFCKAKLISCDIADCRSVSSWSEWMFIQSDDIVFAAQFPEYCRQRDITPAIDVLFLDTSHLYDHTVQELKSWLPLLSEHGKALFHDTNQKRLGYRKDGRLMAGIDNRGVIAALEDYFKRKFDETRDFTDVCDGWLIRHTAYSNGFTILQKLL